MVMIRQNVIFVIMMVVCVVFNRCHGCFVVTKVFRGKPFNKTRILVFQIADLYLDLYRCV